MSRAFADAGWEAARESAARLGAREWRSDRHDGAGATTGPTEPEESSPADCARERHARQRFDAAGIRRWVGAWVPAFPDPKCAYRSRSSASLRGLVGHAALLLLSHSHILASQVDNVLECPPAPIRVHTGADPTRTVGVVSGESTTQGSWLAWLNPIPGRGAGVMTPARGSAPTGLGGLHRCLSIRSPSRSVGASIFADQPRYEGASR